jgi:stress response protein SCP2
VDVDKLAGSVKCIMFVASAYSGGTFKNVETARAELRVISADGSKRVVCRFALGGRGENTSLIMCCLRRGQQYGTWMATEINVPTIGTNWQECKEVIRLEVDKFVDDFLKGERKLSAEKTFLMKKDDSAFLPDDCQAVLVGLGWECKGSIDLDASIIALDENKKELFIVYFGELRKPGVEHAGDNTTGDGDGDDEVIRIDLTKLSSHVKELYITVNIYS